ncbi:MAG: outer membrane beta-barrel protein [Bacteroidaceae bacterium]|nr:outer membrane beta-barrel protein [Bacteroidaceae bacterium]
MKHFIHFNIVAIILSCVLSLSVRAEEALPQRGSGEGAWQKWGPTTGLKGGGFIARAGYVIGGTTPLPLPAEVRAVNSFSPRGGISLGIDGYRMFSKRWGISLGAHFFWEGFHTSADVKNYYVWLEQEGEITKGYFTGTNVTNTEMWGVTVPLLATLRMSPRWNVSAGPYLSYFFKQTFTGEVYDNDKGVGYLREDTPVGTKILMSSENPTPYPDDFADNMLPMSVGLEVAFDWKAIRHMNVFGLLDWGMTNIWRRDFEAISFKMYPIYATVGVAYRY